MIVQTLPLYPDRPSVTLTTYVLTDSPEMLNGQMRPAVLICPGGAYLGCSDREAEPVALRFAAMGYHAFVLRYSTYSSGGFGTVDFSRDLPPNPETIHPAPLRDIGKAFLTLHAHADEWLIDMERVAICGFSAGGHNCAMYSVYWHDPIITAHFGQPPEAFRPAAAILGYAITDYHLMFGDNLEEFERALSNAANVALFGVKDPTPAMLDAASPALRVTAKTPPTFLWATAGDALVPAENTTRMASALARAGVPFEVHVFEGGPHGLSLADQATAGSLMDIDADAAQWIMLAGAWLQKRFALRVPPRPAWMDMQASQTDSD